MRNVIYFNHAKMHANFSFQYKNTEFLLPQNDVIFEYDMINSNEGFPKVNRYSIDIVSIVLTLNVPIPDKVKKIS